MILESPSSAPGAAGAPAAAAGTVPNLGAAPDVIAARDRAFSYLLSIQKPDGGWEGEMVWNTMILSQYVIVKRMVGQTIEPAAREKMIQHYRVTRSGPGWGMHGESPPYVFFTTLAYVALRLLGVAADDPLCKEARTWLHQQKGGVLAIPTWGKLWLALCDLYGYEGVNPFPPEVFLLPKWVPLSPINYYCHTRYIYLGIAYLYGRRFKGHLGPIVKELREELYEIPYEDLDFAAHRHEIAITDLYVRPTTALRTAYDVLYAYEKRPVRALREAALHHCFDRLLYEQRASRYQGISPVNGLLNCLAIYSYDPHHPDLALSLEGVEAWKWEDDAEGIRYCGARSNTWDTAFALQALVSGGNAPASASDTPPLSRPEIKAAIHAAYEHLVDLQMKDELPHHHEEHREAIRGGWCFSDGVHRWAVSDCTAEAVVGMLQAERAVDAVTLPPGDRLPLERVEAAVRFILSRQNQDGGFGTYEPRRGPSLLETINPSEMYGSCMTERSYLECTASSLRGLGQVRSRYGAQLSPALRHAVDSGIEHALKRLSGAQRSDGSFPGFWGINFTYAIFHVVKAFRAAGIPSEDARIQRAAEWLRTKQRADGGWGEHYSSCLTEEYVEHSESQVVMTSWALLALLEAAKPTDPTIERGVRWLLGKQLPDGSFPQQAQNGVFFGTAMLDYRLYKTYFPTWALARYCAIR